MDAAKQLALWLTRAKKTVLFGGAGVSTESGIPDFRSTDGLYSQTWKYPPETILSHGFFQRNTEEFYRFYRQKMLFPDARPNAAHTALAEWEEAGLLSSVITQNIDGLHQKAGSKHVLELHGSVWRYFCVRCGKSFTLPDILAAQGVPKCGCGGVIKPDVVLYGEQLPAHTVEEALDEIAAADLMIVGGTSLSVYPAAGFITDFPGRMVIINRSPTPMDRQADLLVSDPIGSFFSAVQREIGAKRK